MIAIKSSAGISNLRIMVTLLAKDWRIFRAPITGLIVANIGCYLIALGGIHPLAQRLHGTIKEQILEAIWEGAFWSVLLTALLGSSFGGVALASERKDHSADFLGMMPVTRAQIILSKLLLCTLAIAGPIVAAAVIGIGLFKNQYGYMESETIVQLWNQWSIQITYVLGFHFLFYEFISLALALFGIGWMLSTFSESAPISTCVSVAITFGVFVFVESNFRLEGFAGTQVILTSVMLVIGLPSLLIGTIHYLRRIRRNRALSSGILGVSMATLDSSAAVSNWEILRALLAKDWRLFRMPMIALLTVIVGCYSIAEVSHLFLDPRTPYLAACVLAVNLTAVLASVFGGVAIAGERRERTCDFLGVLPVTRQQIILSKWLAALLILIPCSGVNVVAAVWIGHVPDFKGGPVDIMAFASSASLWFACTTCFFGVAWLIGTFSSSATVSACVSIAVTIFSFALSALLMDSRPRQGEWGPTVAFAVPTLVIGLLSMTGGTIYYRRRIAP